MNTNRRHAVAALIAAGLLWGTTVPLSKLALEWLSPAWLTATRFGLAAAVLLAVAPRSGLRAAFTPKVLARKIHEVLSAAQVESGPEWAAENEMAGEPETASCG